ncbi:MAG: bifunctional hydroxymethylpyrimidine kinase/phosphomethylpyrimidine kinase, partial [Nitrospinota bacterium]|nr:bifunctional hydroxymethylpyrimidine kinase/phosphomethylpyrimidine kinase [Nitrospinota bacterium]
MRPAAMTIAGSDSGGGAGVQGDIKTFAAQGVFGVTVITALTAQNTKTVAGIHPVPPEFVALQIQTIMEDIPVLAAKTGMLFNAAIIKTVAEQITAARISALVVDPVMIAKSGAHLLDDGAVGAMVELLIPLAHCVTPNIPEAERLTGIGITGLDQMKDAARKIAAMGAKNVVVKGGHSPKAAMVTDLALLDGEFVEFTRPRFDTQNTHGTGCAFSAAITAGLARGLEIHSA